MSSAAHTVIQSDEERSRAVKRAFLFAVLGVIAAIASCTGVHFLYVFVSTADSADLADRYLTALEEDRVSEAYRLTSATFRDEQGPEAFAEVVDGVSMAGHELMSWENRTLDHNRFNIYTGTLTTESGRTLPFVMEVVRGGQRVARTNADGSRQAGRGARRMVPPGAEGGDVEADRPRDDAGLRPGRA